jgi:3-phenylpropionate/cinnamic acid dioxygenase small subunit
MKGLARRNTHLKYESPSTYQSKVMTNVKVLEKNMKLKGQRVNIMVLDKRTCQKEYTCDIYIGSPMVCDVI